MKIAVLGSAPSSIKKAPFGDQSWSIWACSPGAYPVLARIDEFWEVHRWEPGVIGKAETQKPWFSPEYVQWLKTVPPVVWVADPDALRDIAPKSRMLPWQTLINKYGHYVWTSSVAYMLAQAIERILDDRKKQEADLRAADVSPEVIKKTMEERQQTDVIGLWGVDMAANEELYSGQRAACQFFLQVVVALKIGLYVPPESDLLVPPPMYGVSEIHHRAIKYLERQREVEGRIAAANAQAESFRNQSIFLQGALDDLRYHQTMWLHEGEDSLAFDFKKVFGWDEVPSAAQPVVSLQTESVVAPSAAAAWSDPKAEAHSEGPAIHDPLKGRDLPAGAGSS